MNKKIFIVAKEHDYDSKVCEILKVFSNAEGACNYISSIHRANKTHEGECYFFTQQWEVEDE